MRRWWWLAGIMAFLAIPYLIPTEPTSDKSGAAPAKPRTMSREDTLEVQRQLAQPAVEKLRSLPRIERTEWRRDTLVVSTTVTGTEEDFELLALQICKSLPISGIYVQILDHRYLELGKIKTREHTLCR